MFGNRFVSFETSQPWPHQRYRSFFQLKSSLDIRSGPFSKVPNSFYDSTFLSAKKQYDLKIPLSSKDWKRPSTQTRISFNSWRFLTRVSLLKVEKLIKLLKIFAIISFRGKKFGSNVLSIRSTFKTIKTKLELGMAQGLRCGFKKFLC